MRPTNFVTRRNQASDYASKRDCVTVGRSSLFPGSRFRDADSTTAASSRTGQSATEGVRVTTYTVGLDDTDGGQAAVRWVAAEPLTSVDVVNLVNVAELFGEPRAAAKQRIE